MAQPAQQFASRSAGYPQAFARCLYGFLVLSASCLNAWAQNGEQYFDSNGARIHYVDQGIGKPVILMHGLNGDITLTWFDSGIAQALQQEGYRVLALDARAHGLSDAPLDPSQYGREMAFDVQRLMAHVGIEKAHLVGYSMGANILVKLKESQPDLFMSLTLIGWGWSEGDGPTSVQLQTADSLEQGGGFMPLYRAAYPDLTEEEREARSAATVANLADVRATAALLRGYFLGVTVQTIRTNTVPVLAIVGEADPRKERVDMLRGVMPNLEAVVIPGADHASVVTHPVLLTSLKEFLQRH